MRAPWRRGAAGLLALLVLALVACGPSSGGGSVGTAPPTATAAPSGADEPRPLPVGLDAAMTGGGSAAGQAIQRGIELAIDEINGQGGIHERPLTLVVRDDQGDPARGVANVHELVEGQHAVAVFAGGPSPVVLAELDAAQQLAVPLVVPWATATRIVQNDRKPSFAFRIAANDRAVAQRLATYLARELGRQRPALFVTDDAQGAANAETISQALAEAGLRPAAVERLGPGESDLAPQFAHARDAGFDSLLLATDDATGAQVLRALTALGLDTKTAPVVTHPSVAGPALAQLGDAANDVRTVQTYSFFGEQNIPGKRVLSGYLRKYGGKGPADLAAPTGVADAFDALHVLARALREASDPTSGDAVRHALENLQTPYEGLIKTYQHPFTADNHEALTADDYLVAVWKDGELLPDR